MKTRTVGKRKLKKKWIAITMIFTLNPSAIAAKFEQTNATLKNKNQVDWVGQAMHLVKKSTLALGQKVPMSPVIDLKMQEGSIFKQGRVMVLFTVPSLDTPVCDIQAHTLGETQNLSPEVRRVMLSKDLPYALRRFKTKTKLDKIEYFSDYRSGRFSDELGITLAENKLLSRGVYVFDAQGILRYKQEVPKILQLPNMDKAFQIANTLVSK